MVIFGHAYAIVGDTGQRELIHEVMHIDYCGSLAVKIFFFLSGLFVTNSLINNGSVISFAIKRILRIYPGLIACVLLTAVIISPVITTLPIEDYLSSPLTLKYIVGTGSLTDIQWRLPGVIENHKYGINGSIWTLPFEMLCYSLLIALRALGFLSDKLLSGLTFITLFVVSLLNAPLIPFFGPNPEARYLIAFFLAGSILARFKGMIYISWNIQVLLVLASYMSFGLTCGTFILYVTIIYLFLLIFSSRPIVALKLEADLSYGVYLYGFVIQQVINYYYPHRTVDFNQIVSSIIALGLSYLSWTIVENPSIKLSSYLYGAMSDGPLKLDRDKTS